MIGSNKGNWGRYGLQAFGISVLGPLLFYLINYCCPVKLK